MCWWVYLELVHWRIFRTSHSGHFRSRCGTRTRLPRTDLANTCISEFKQPRAMHILFYTQFLATLEFVRNFSTHGHSALSIRVVFPFAATHALACHAQTLQTPTFLLSNNLVLDLLQILYFTHNFLPHALIPLLVIILSDDILHFPFGPFSLWHMLSLTAHNLCNTCMPKFKQPSTILTLYFTYIPVHIRPWICLQLFNKRITRTFHLGHLPLFIHFSHTNFCKHLRYIIKRSRTAYTLYFILNSHTTWAHEFDSDYSTDG